MLLISESPFEVLASSLSIDSLEYDAPILSDAENMNEPIAETPSQIYLSRSSLTFLQAYQEGTATISVTTLDEQYSDSVSIHVTSENWYTG